jgi:hypothetical protein
MSQKTTTCPCCAAICAIGSDNGAYWFEPLQEKQLRERVATLERDVAILREIVLREMLASLRDVESGQGALITGGPHVPSALRLILGGEDPDDALLALRE